ncbi:CoA transferase [Amycolatopsis acidicola]|uniref:CoA transferase n=1 Tax=Amycolatopsis acidicola TaxID=2596893 RepID=A0A5N0UYV9_9PSEU|nr:CoA transferase [Amycolatopsis acidicola]KAA9157798.1 CoA transferase [Amycolatopsis acidicola]
MGTRDRGALSGVRIADFGWVLAGPYATMLLSYLGAEVIKIESRRRPDEQRIAHRAGFSEDLEASSNFLEVNLNKRSVSLNIATEEGAALARRIVAQSDVVVENMRPGVMDRLGLGYQELVKVKPDIIMASISGWGSTGPLRQYTAYAPCFASFGGLANLTGYADGEPNTSTSAMDARSGTAAAFAVMMALTIRQRTGQGQYIDMSSCEALNSLIGENVLEYVMNGRSPMRQGNADAIMAPHNCYRAAGEDKWISIAVGTDAEWDGLRAAMGDPEWARDEAFASTYSRWQHRDRLDPLLQQWTERHAPGELTELLQAHGVPAFPSYSAEELFADPHLRARDSITEVKHPVLGERLAVSPPWRLSETPAAITKTAPLLGEDNQYVLCDLLGLSEDEVARLAEQKVVY